MNITDLYKGSLEAIVLQLIRQHEEMYGYELTQKAKEISGGHLKITEGTLYPLLHKLEAEGTLSSELKPYGNRMRKYYRLTPSGTQEQENASLSLQEYIGHLQQFLNPKLV